MFNYLGLEVFSLHDIKATNGFIETVSNLGLSQGVYVVIVKQAGKRYNKKVLISK